MYVCMYSDRPKYTSTRSQHGPPHVSQFQPIAGATFSSTISLALAHTGKAAKTYDLSLRPTRRLLQGALDQASLSRWFFTCMCEYLRPGRPLACSREYMCMYTHPPPTHTHICMYISCSPRHKHTHIHRHIIPGATHPTNPTPYRNPRNGELLRCFRTAAPCISRLTCSMCAYLKGLVTDGRRVCR